MGSGATMCMAPCPPLHAHYSSLLTHLLSKKIEHRPYLFFVSFNLKLVYYSINHFHYHTSPFIYTMRKTLVIGASENPERYSYKAITSLLKHHQPVEAIGQKTGTIGQVQFHTAQVHLTAIDTVTLYINPEVQKAYYAYIISLHPQRVIFNPGTENPEFYQLLEDAGISYIEACTLVLLSTGQFE